jgi:transposase
MEDAMDEVMTAKKEAPQTTEKFVQEVRRKTRRKFTAEEKIRVVLEAMKREVPITELCRREGIPTAVYYTWVKDFMEAGKARLKRDSLRDASKDEVVRLKRENEQLKNALGEKELALQIIKKSL